MTEKSTFARRVRAAKPRATKHEVRDDVVSGLALAIQPTGVRTNFVSRMVRGRRRYATIGSADALAIPEARREARRLIASYIEPAKKDSGPRTPGHPMDAFAEEFLERYARHWKPRILESSAYRVRNHILPAFGYLTVDAITVEHVRDWLASMAGKPASANRAMPVLSMMMRMAELWGYRPHNSNPCRNTRRYKMKPMERFLTAEEMARLNAVLTRDEYWCPNVVAIARLLMLTGCLFREIVSLEWERYASMAGWSAKPRRWRTGATSPPSRRASSRSRCCRRRRRSCSQRLLEEDGAWTLLNTAERFPKELIKLRQSPRHQRAGTHERCDFPPLDGALPPDPASQSSERL